MSDHSLYPSFLKVFYTSGGNAHIQTLPVFAYNTLGTWNLAARGVAFMTAAAWLAGWANVCKAVHSTTATINYAELWTMASPTSAPINVAVFPLAVAGTGSGGFVRWEESVYTLRTELGGILKVYLMETISTVDQKIAISALSGASAAISNYLLADATCCVTGRDGAHPSAGVNFITKTNDALRKRALNP